MTIKLVAPVVAALSLTACEKTDTALLDAPQVPYAKVSAVADDAQALQRLLTDTTHTIPKVGGNEYRYLGDAGAAVIRTPDAAEGVRGEWRVVQTPRGGAIICIGATSIPADINLNDERCQSGKEFAASVFFLAIGNPVGLR